MKPQADFGKVIAAIEARGLEVRVYHERRVVDVSTGAMVMTGPWQGMTNLIKESKHNNVLAVDPQWGATTVKIVDPTTKQCWIGHASTMLPDQFNRKRGLAIAMGRALKDARIEVWKLLSDYALREALGEATVSEVVESVNKETNKGS